MRICVNLQVAIVDGLLNVRIIARRLANDFLVSLPYNYVALILSPIKLEVHAEIYWEKNVSVGFYFGCIHIIVSEHTTRQQTE